MEAGRETIITPALQCFTDIDNQIRGQVTFDMAECTTDLSVLALQTPNIVLKQESDRSEERRVGKECRSRWSPYH